MEKIINKKNIIGLGIVLISLYFAFFLSNLIFPKWQLFIDLEKIDDNKVLFAMHGRDITEYDIKDNIVDYNVNILDKEYNINFKIEDKEITNFLVNGEEFKGIEKISKYATTPAYKDTYCVKLNVTSSKHYIAFVVLSIVFIFLFFLFFKALYDKDKYNHKMTYSNSGFKAIGWKPIIISFVITLLSMVLYVGCDLKVISESVIMYIKGIDFYQMFSCLNEYKNVTLLMWQYDSAMLIGYSLPAYITYPLLRFFNPTRYHWVQVFEYKMFNMLLINLLVLTVISFLIDKKIIKSGKAKVLYYLSVYNPLTFYVAIWFLQFDMLPAYLMTLGILLMDNLKDNKYISGMLIALALSSKMTMWMFVPSFLILELFIYLKEKNLSDGIKHLLTVGFIVVIMLGITRVLKSPIAVALTGLAQSERIWYTAFAYLPGVFLFIAIFSIIVSFILNYYDINLKIPKVNMILITIMSFGVITMIFSFGTVSTPSFWLQTMGAFIILLAVTDDDFSKFLIMCFATLIIVQYALLPEGDITASLKFIGKPTIVDLLRDSLIEKGKFERYQSLIFTISQAVMFAFVFIFSKVIGKLKNSK